MTKSDNVLSTILGARKFAVLIGLIAGVLSIGGAYLAVIGGSWYYVITGAVLIGVTVLLWRHDRRAGPLFAIMLAYTWLWAFWEVGIEPWLLLPRVFAPTLLGLWFLLPARWRGYEGRVVELDSRSPLKPQTAVALGLVAAAAVGLLGPSSFAQTLSSTMTGVVGAGSGDWPQYGRDQGGSNYSDANLLNRQNVKGLEVAWTFRTGDLPGPDELKARGMAFEATPIKVGERVFFCTPHSLVYALDAETGKELWRFDAKPNYDQVPHLACRGVSYWNYAGAGSADAPSAPGTSGNAAPGIVCEQRIFFGSADAKLWSLDATTGKPCDDFGAQGAVDLTDGMGEVLPGFLYPSSPPAVIAGKVVLGNWVSDNQSVSEPSGTVRAYDGQTGALAWAWDMGRPDRTGAPPPGEEYTRGTPNAWSALSADPELGLVYVPTGNATPDFWGGERRSFDDKYSSSIVALDATTGRPRWSFQTTHHDLWDYDVPAQPALVDIPFPSGPRRALVQATKRGDLFILDRATGKPIFPVVERPAPQGGAPGEKLSPTQPFSSVSLLPPRLEESSMWGTTPLDQMWCRIQFQKARYDGIFTPPRVTDYAIQYPGGLGVTDWGGISVDPKRGLVFANTSLVGYYNRLLPRDEAPPTLREIQPVSQPSRGAYMSSTAAGPMMGTPYVVETTPFLSPLGVPCNQPPWGHMQAIDLTTGKLAWKKPLGTGRNNGPWGIKSHLNVTLGVPSLGGSTATASGLVFVAGTIDDYIRALDSETGKELWRASLPAGGQARPSTYISSRSGRQFVVIAAGGNAIIGTKMGDYVVAYALPKG